MPPVTNRLGYAKRQRAPLNSGRERACIGSKGEGFDAYPSSLPANGPASIACPEYDDNLASVRPSPCLAAVVCPIAPDRHIVAGARFIVLWNLSFCKSI